MAKCIDRPMPLSKSSCSWSIENYTDMTEIFDIRVIMYFIFFQQRPPFKCNGGHTCQLYKTYCACCESNAYSSLFQ